MGDDRFILCFETEPDMHVSYVSCRMGVVSNNSISFGEALEHSAAQLVSVSSFGQGREFAVCSQGSTSEISCRWGHLVNGPAATEIQWADVSLMSFAFDGR